MSSDEEKIRVVRNATDLQRLKLEKLMKNPEKLAFIPEKSKDRKFPAAPEFVRNVMGSSAGAGSGEFHVYRHIRRREYARQEYLNNCSEKDKLDLEYQEKLEANARQAEAKTAKKREKRRRTKQRGRDKKMGKWEKERLQSEDEEEESDDEDDRVGSSLDDGGKNRDGVKVSDDMKATNDVNCTDVDKYSDAKCIDSKGADGSTAKEILDNTAHQVKDSIKNISDTTKPNRSEDTSAVPSAEAKPAKKSLKELLSKTNALGV